MARDFLGPLSQLVILLTGNLIYLTRVSNASLFPELDGLSVTNVTAIFNRNGGEEAAGYELIEFEVSGRNFFGGMAIKSTRRPADRNSICQDLEDYRIDELHVQEGLARFTLELPYGVENVFFCIPHFEPLSSSVLWYHQGGNISLHGDAESQEETVR